jgi:hypothetical protein
MSARPYPSDIHAFFRCRWGLPFEGDPIFLCPKSKFQNAEKIEMIKSWMVYKAAIKYLPSGAIQNIFRKSTRLIYMWAANPEECEVVARNGLDRMRMFLDALDTYGGGDIAREAIDYLAEPLGGHFAPFGNEVSDRQDVDGELADLFSAGGIFSAKLREALSDGTITPAERITIKEHARQVARELNQVLDAAGMKGVS